MKKIFVNLKRFEVSKEKGGICPMENPIEWTKWVVDESIKLNLGNIDNVFVCYFLPEATLYTGLSTLNSYPESKRTRLNLGCQSVYRADIKAGANFGAFTSNRPALALKEIGCNWTMIAHSEERRDKLQMIAAYDPSTETDPAAAKKAADAVDALLNAQVKCAIERDMNVLFCIGETAEQKGPGGYDEYAPRVKAVIRSQIENAFKGIDKEKVKDIGLAYEPIWAIGPGKTPPDSDYIAFVSGYAKEVTKELYGYELDVVYGGGLKEENAEAVASVSTIDGGLVALTKFVAPIGFDPQSLKNIIMAYVK